MKYIVSSVLGLFFLGIQAADVKKDEELKILYGKEVAEKIATTYFGSPLTYTAGFLRNEYIGWCQKYLTTSEKDVRETEFFLQQYEKNDNYFTKLSPVRTLLSSCEKNLKAYNAYATKIGKIPLEMETEYKTEYNQTFLQCIKITHRKIKKIPQKQEISQQVMSLPSSDEGYDDNIDHELANLPLK